MSGPPDLPPAIARLIGDLRAEVRVLGSRVQALEARIALLEEFDLVSQPGTEASELSARPTAPLTPSRPVGASEAYPASPAPVAAHAAASSVEEGNVEAHDQVGRERLAREIGQFFVRCRNGRFRGQSGRARLDLPSRVYLAVCNHQGEAIAPRSYSRLSDLRSELFEQGRPANAVFCGFATSWEARLALEEAQLPVPSSLEARHVRAQPVRRR